MQQSNSAQVRSGDGSEDNPDVTATINVDEEIVHGTASVRESNESPRQDHNNAHIKVRHFERGGDQREQRALSQADAMMEIDQAMSVDDRRMAATRDERQQNQAAITHHSATSNVESLPDTTRPRLQQTVPHTAGSSQNSNDDNWSEQVLFNRQATAEAARTEQDVLGENHIRQSYNSSLPHNVHQTESETDRAQASVELNQSEPKQVSNDTEANNSAQNNNQAVEERDDEDTYSDDRDQHNDEGDLEETRQQQDQQKIPEQDLFESTLDAVNITLPATMQNRPAKKTNNISTSKARIDTAILMDDLEKLVVSLNHTAMAKLKSDQFTAAKKLLFKAELNLIQVDDECAELQATSDSINDLGDHQFAYKEGGIGAVEALKNKLMGLTYNNLGCLCKQQKDLKGALEYLKKALYYESRLEDQSHDDDIIANELSTTDEMDAIDHEFQADMRTTKCNSAGTILNICAILSKMNKHKQAHEYAEQAVAKLRHSMKLTKHQVEQTCSRQAYAEENLEESQRQGLTEESETFAQQAAKYEAHRFDLENQWVNLATTVVIAHYNAAVELEFMSLWREALIDYDKAAKIAHVAMKAQNPMTVKIDQAIKKMRMKVRNKVQLPDKFQIDSNKRQQQSKQQSSQQSRTQGRSQFGSSKVQSNQGVSSLAPHMKDWQLSVTSNMTNGLENKPAATMSNEFTLKGDLETLPATVVGNFYPNEHNAATSGINSVGDMAQSKTSNQPNNATVVVRDSIEDSRLMVTSKTTGGRNHPANLTQQPKSPLSLKSIIGKLQKTERLEAQRLQPKGVKLRANNTRRTNSINVQRQQVNSFGGNGEVGVGSDRSASYQQQQQLPWTAQTIRNTSQPGSRISRNQANKRHTLNSAGAPGIDPNFLPSLSKPQSIGAVLNSRNGARVSTVQGGARAISNNPLQEVVERQNISTNQTMRSHHRGGQKMANNSISGRPPVDVKTNAWASNSIDQQSHINQHPHHKRQFTTITDDVKTINRLSPESLQMHLSVTQERKLIEQHRKLGATKTKREQDISFFLGHIKRQNKSNIHNQKKTQRVSSPGQTFIPSSYQGLAPMTSELAALKTMQIMEQPTKNLANSAYLPKGLKKTIKQRQQNNQLKSLQHAGYYAQQQQYNTINHPAEQPDLNQKLETAFQREMASWKRDREFKLTNRLKELEDLHMSRLSQEDELNRARQPSIVQTPILSIDRRQVNDDSRFSNKIGQRDNRNPTATFSPSQENTHQRPAGDFYDALSAEQAQEAVSAQQDSQGKLPQQEEEVGNFRQSPHTQPGSSKVAATFAARDTMQTPPLNGAQDKNQKTQITVKEMTIFDEKDENRPNAEELTFEKQRPTETGEKKKEDDMSPIAQIRYQKTTTLSDALSGTGHEIQHDQTSLRPSEFIEVEDIVSADTNGHQQNLDSHPTSSYPLNAHTNNGEGYTIQDVTAESNHQPDVSHELYRKRIHADSALQYASTKGGAVSLDRNAQTIMDCGNAHRSQNAKSSLAMMSNFDAIADPNNSLQARERESLIVKGTAKFKQEQEYGRQMPKAASQIGGSSIAVSQVTETVLTQKSEHLINYGGRACDASAINEAGAQNYEMIEERLNTNESDLHEDTIDAWKVQNTSERKNGLGTRPASRIKAVESPDCTEENATQDNRRSQIGDGAIFIKKSTDYHQTTNRRIKLMGSQSSFEQTENNQITQTQPRARLNTMLIRDSASINHTNALDRPDSRQVSDITVITDQVVQNETHIIQTRKDYKVAKQPFQKRGSHIDAKGLKSVLAGSDSLAQKSEIVAGKYPSSLTLETSSIQGDTVSQLTVLVNQKDGKKHGLRIKQIASDLNMPASLIQSGQTTIQNANANAADMNRAVGAVGVSDSFMTPRPGMLSQAITQHQEAGANDPQRMCVERSSIDTENTKQLPSHIHRSNPQKRPPTQGNSGAAANQRNQQQRKNSTSIDATATRRYVASLATQNQAPKLKPGHEILQKHQQRTNVNAARVSQKQAAIPARIHLQNSEKYDNQRTSLTSPQTQHVATDKRLQNEIPAHYVSIDSQDQVQTFVNSKDNPLATPITRNYNSNIQNVPSNSHQTENVTLAPGSQNLGVVGQTFAEEDADPTRQGSMLQTNNQTEDRVAKIQERISKLNTNLIQFGTDIEEQKKDPLLKSTHRSTASKHGLQSQISRDTNMTMPAALAAAAQQVSAVQDSHTDVTQVPANVRALQDKRLIAQLQSAPGRSRVKM